eukprot:TRINITY_DN82570_c0_g1_i1.p1 TRINITY_DN82570_c0_g1~~TRINITY_DN82570_c0_g1_i1.p1  ORF type:complete len:314 (+),score=33.64 TRINITY_DN82570_c0_g1_i1:137-1078(+)
MPTGSDGILVDDAPVHPPEVDSTKPCRPTWTIPKASRDAVKKLLISHKHAADLVGRGTPGPGAYTPQRLRKSPSCSFGTSKRPSSASPLSRDPASALLTNVRNAPNQADAVLRRPQSATMGTAPRHVVPVAPDLSMPIGADSPGPLRYKPSTNFTASASPSFSMGSRTPVNVSRPQTTAKVGPGTYPTHAPEHQTVQSKQHGGKKGPLWTMCKHDRWKAKLRDSSQTSGRLWDGMGERRLQFKRELSAPPSCSFGKQTRQAREKQGHMQMPSDRGPAGDLPAAQLACPELPPRLRADLRPHMDPVPSKPGGRD